MDQDERRIFLIEYLIKEDGSHGDLEIPKDKEGQKKLLRALLNVRAPKEADGEFCRIQDEYFREETRLKGITDISELEFSSEGICLWQGDITTLRCDAIVNAANKYMIGCWIPNHGCIDNCIHTYAGIELRKECARIMEKQGHLEETGRAKITPAYNLPCRYIIHTVGPIINGPLTDKDKELLASCYISCMEKAEENGLENLALCCISTGEFHFPNAEAAQIAVSEVRKFLKGSKSLKKIIFNVFKDRDREIYEKLL